MSLNRLTALQLLSECTGDDIWSWEYCLERGIPADWLEELADCYESGFTNQTETIYYKNSVVNQFHGVRDVDLAVRLAKLLGARVDDLIESTITRADFVRAVHERIEEG